MNMIIPILPPLVNDILTNSIISNLINREYWTLNNTIRLGEILINKFFEDPQTFHYWITPVICNIGLYFNIFNLLTTMFTMPLLTIYLTYVSSYLEFIQLIPYNKLNQEVIDILNHNNSQLSMLLQSLMYGWINIYEFCNLANININNYPELIPLINKLKLIENNFTLFDIYHNLNTYDHIFIILNIINEGEKLLNFLNINGGLDYLSIKAPNMNILTKDLINILIENENDNIINLNNNLRNQLINSMNNHTIEMRKSSFKYYIGIFLFYKYLKFDINSFFSF